MFDSHIDLLTIGLIVGTRVALGIGIGLLLGGQFTSERR